MNTKSMLQQLHREKLLSKGLEDVDPSLALKILSLYRACENNKTNLPTTVKKALTSLAKKFPNP